MPGPIIQKAFFEILSWSCSDFTKWFCQPPLTKCTVRYTSRQEDKDFHRLLMKETPSSTLKDYRMTQNTYNETSAGFHAIRPLFEVAETIQYPTAALALKFDMYVDDLSTGTSSKEEAEVLQDALIKHLAKAGFHYVSGHRVIFHSLNAFPIPIENHLPPNTSSLKNTLWKHLVSSGNQKQDVFTFNVKSADKSPQTKRQILSEVTSIFDLLVIQLKSIIQTLRLDNSSWDQPLNHNLTQQNNHLSGDLKSIEDIDTARFIFHTNEPSMNPLHLHCFCGASTTVFSAGVYIRQPISQGRFQSQLLVAKTRVAPIKTLCVPRLELCTARLGAQLVLSIRISLVDEQFPDLEVFSWIDSAITLAWIKNHSSRWKTFVANRVAKIRKSVPAENWKHVPIESNPGDCDSRGILPRKF